MTAKNKLYYDFSFRSSNFLALYVVLIILLKVLCIMKQWQKTIKDIYECVFAGLIRAKDSNVIITTVNPPARQPLWANELILFVLSFTAECGKM